MLITYITQDVEIDLSKLEDDELIETLEERGKFSVVENLDIEALHRSFETDSEESFKRELKYFFRKYSRL